MSEKFIYASISENGTINGEKGDQNGKEVKVTNPYDFGQDRFIRLKNPLRRIQFVAYAKIFADCDLVGYGQDDRDTFYHECKKRKWNIVTILNDIADKKFPKVNCDCSSFVSTLINLIYGKEKVICCTTRNILQCTVNKYPNSFCEISKDTKKLNGDFQLKQGKHITIFYSGTI